MGLRYNFAINRLEKHLHSTLFQPCLNQLGTPSSEGEPALFLGMSQTVNIHFSVGLICYETLKLSWDTKEVLLVG